MGNKLEENLNARDDKAGLDEVFDQSSPVFYLNFIVSFFALTVLG